MKTKSQLVAEQNLLWIVRKIPLPDGDSPSVGRFKKTVTTLVATYISFKNSAYCSKFLVI
jgi:hypothetical protein